MCSHLWSIQDNHNSWILRLLLKPSHSFGCLVLRSIWICPNSLIDICHAICTHVMLHFCLLVHTTIHHLGSYAHGWLVERFWRQSLIRLAKFIIAVSVGAILTEFTQLRLIEEFALLRFVVAVLCLLVAKSLRAVGCRSSALLSAWTPSLRH